MQLNLLYQFKNKKKNNRNWCHHFFSDKNYENTFTCNYKLTSYSWINFMLSSYIQELKSQLVSITTDGQNGTILVPINVSTVDTVWYHIDEQSIIKRKRRRMNLEQE